MRTEVSHAAAAAFQVASILGRPGEGPEDVPSDALELAIGGGVIAIASRSGRSVRVWNADGEAQSTVIVDQPFYEAGSIDVDAAGNVFTATLAGGTGGERGRLFWVAAGDGLVYIAHSGSAEIDTVRVEAIMPPPRHRVRAVDAATYPPVVGRTF